jgi:hypothetical protein
VPDWVIDIHDAARHEAPYDLKRGLGIGASSRATRWALRQSRPSQAENGITLSTRLIFGFGVLARQCKSRGQVS